MIHYIMFSFVIIIGIILILSFKSYKNKISQKTEKTLLQALFLTKYIIIFLIIGAFVIMPISMFSIILLVNNKMIAQMAWLESWVVLICGMIIGFYIGVRALIKVELISRKVI